METFEPSDSSAPTSGRSARERIIRAAGQLFYERGIHATGVDALVRGARVSRRTFYQYFESKNALIESYLLQPGVGGTLECEAQLEREDLSPAERLMAIFDPLEALLRSPSVARGCPLHNAAVEAAGGMPAIARIVERKKLSFQHRLAALAAEAGVVDPDAFARRLAVIFEGANALATTRNDPEVVKDARDAAEVLLKAAIAD